MTGASQAAWYADHACQRTVQVEQNVLLARDTYRLRLGCPEIARSIVPGQFVMLKLTGFDDPLLGRPLALYDTVLSGQEPVAIDIVYLAGGKMTRKLAALRPGDLLTVWGPLGNGFPPREIEHLIMVAGGIGQTPMLALGQEYLGLRTYGSPARHRPRAQRVSLCYGARRQEYLAGVDHFQKAGIEVHVSTDDGSFGHHGLVTDLLSQVLSATDKRSSHVVCCGPEPMMKAVSGLTKAAGVSCEVSLETPMACGLGICFTCVAKVLDEHGGWDYRRTCVEGPVFDASRIVW